MDKTKQQGSTYFSSTRIAFIAMFATLSGVLYILNFSMPFAFPGFLEFNLSDIPILIGTFTLGPAAGAVIVVVKILIKLVVKGTSTMFVGELSDLLTSCSFALTAGFIYRKHRTFKGALAAMGVGTLVEVVVALITNRFVLVPFYVQFFFGGRWEPLIGMMTPLFPNCTRETFYNFYLWASVLPFNMLRCIVTVIVTLPLYKRISRLINNVNRKIYKDSDTTKRAVSKTDIIVIVAAVSLIAALLLFALLRYFVFKS